MEIKYRCPKCGSMADFDVNCDQVGTVHLTGEDKIARIEQIDRAGMTFSGWDIDMQEPMWNADAEIQCRVCMHVGYLYQFDVEGI